MALYPPDKLTTVVNYWPETPVFSEPATESERYIGDNAIYKLQAIKLLPSSKFFLQTRRCRIDVAERLEWEVKDIHTAIAGLNHDDFHKAEWCQTGRIWLPCDSYVLRDYDDGGQWMFDLYMKFAISPEGNALLIVSCHPS